MFDLDACVDRVGHQLVSADVALAASYPGDRGVRQPVHTVYVPADKYGAGTVTLWAAQARAVWATHCGSADMAAVLDLDRITFEEVRTRVADKLVTEAIEDLRIDFEDGYGNRPDPEEDAAATRCAAALAVSVQAGNTAPFNGIRIKSLEAPTRRRGLRTLYLFLSTLVAEGGLPDGFVVTLPKVTSVAQVEVFVEALAQVEEGCGLSVGRVAFEIQIETPQAILGADGTALVARMIHAGDGRVTGLHYGTYDYSASLGVAASYQSVDHPVAHHAKAVMQVAAAGTGVFVCDGSSNRLPVGDDEAVHEAWRLHVRLVRRSLEAGLYQGWDLHPAQLPTRHVATYAFFREGFVEAAARLRSFLHGGDSGFLDEPATASALAGYLLRALDCGATDEVELAERVDADVPTLARLARRMMPAPDWPLPTRGGRKGS